MRLLKTTYVQLASLTLAMSPRSAQCFSAFNLHTNNLGILLKCRFEFNRCQVRSEYLYF